MLKNLVVAFNKKSTQYETKYLWSSFKIYKNSLCALTITAWKVSVFEVFWSVFSHFILLSTEAATGYILFHNQKTLLQILFCLLLKLPKAFSVSLNFFFLSIVFKFSDFPNNTKNVNRPLNFCFFMQHIRPCYVVGNGLLRNIFQNAVLITQVLLL